MKIKNNKIACFTILMHLEHSNESIYWELRNNLEDKLLKKFPNKKIVITYVDSRTGKPCDPNPFENIGISVHYRECEVVPLDFLQQENLLRDILERVKAEKVKYSTWLLVRCYAQYTENSHSFLTHNVALKWYSGDGDSCSDIEIV